MMTPLSEMSRFKNEGSHTFHLHNRSHPSRLPDSNKSPASQPCLHPLATQALITRRRCAVVARSQAFSCESPTSATTTPRPVLAEPSLVSRSALGSPYVPHLITSDSAIYPWGRNGVWGRGQLIMHSPISICGELRRVAVVVAV